MNKVTQYNPLIAGFLRAFYCLFVFGWVCFPVLASAVDVPSLFIVTPQEKATALSQPSAQKTLTLNQKTLNLFSERRVDAIKLNYAGNDTVFYADPADTSGDGSSWFGKDTRGDTEIILTVGVDHLFGRVLGQKSEVVFRPGESAYEVVQVTLDSSKKVPLVGDGVAVLKESSASSKKTVNVAAAVDSPTQIDVMVLYTAAMAAAYPDTQITTRIQYFIDLANIAFANSGIVTRLRLVHSQQVDYPDDSVGDMSEALDTLTLNNGVFAGLEGLRTVHGADQVTLLRRFVDEGCGFAWVLNGDIAPFSYALVHDGVKTDNSGFYCSDFTFAHEVGHNLGAMHDRANSDFSGAFSYSFGYQDPTNQFRTIMAYPCTGDCPIIAHFSNPNVSYQGNVTGITAGQANSADNALTINQTRNFMSAYRSATK